MNLRFFALDGFRGIAALLVATYHIFSDRISGGVDVFFVLAGFFLVDSLIRQDTSTRTKFKKILDYISRILPTALVVVLFVWILSATSGNTSRLKELSLQSFASLFYFENYVLISNQQDYFYPSGWVSPLQQFWAVSVQVQLYILLVLIWIFFHKLTGKKSFFWFVAFASILSFLYALVTTSNAQTTAYFDTLARGWEFGAGALSAVFVNRFLRTPYKLNFKVVGWIGFSLFLLTGLLPGITPLFPAPASAIPVVGTVMMIFFSASFQQNALSKFLASKPVKLLGSISLGLYLWHWPILTFSEAYFGREVTFIEGLLVLGLSLFVAYLSTVLIAKPAKRFTQRPKNILIKTGLILTAAVLSFALFIASSVGVKMFRDFAFEISSASAENKPKDPKSEYFDNGTNQTPEEIRDNKPNEYLLGCHVSTLEAKVSKCRVTSAKNGIEIVAIGGSHVGHWLSAFTEIAQENNWGFSYATKSGCRLGIENSPKSNEAKSCNEWQTSLITSLKKEKPTAIITTGTTTSLDGEIVSEAYLKLWEELEEEGIKVIALRDTPRWDYDPVDCLTRFSASDENSCYLDGSQSLTMSEKEIENFYSSTNVTVVDITKQICPNLKKCPAAMSGFAIYRDKNHLTVDATLNMVPFIKPLFVEAINK